MMSAIDLRRLYEVLISQRRIVVSIVSAAALSGLAIGFLTPPIYTARERILVPTQGISGGSSSVLSGLAQAGAVVPSIAQLSGGRNIGDQMAGLLRSRVIIDQIINHFELRNKYDVRFMFQARDVLTTRTAIRVGKDGFIDIEVEDEHPERAAEMARAYVAQLQNVTNKIAVGEAASRRKFLEEQLQKARSEWEESLADLKRAGLSPQLANTVPEMALAASAQLSQRLQQAEYRLAVLRASQTDSSPEVGRAKAEVEVLRTQIKNAASAVPVSTLLDTRGDGYASAFKKFKQAELVLEGLSRQYELAKVDEAKQGVLIQIVDEAEVPEWKTRPSRLKYLIASGFFGVFCGFLWVVAHYFSRKRNL